MWVGRFRCWRPLRVGLDCDFLDDTMKPRVDLEKGSRATSTIQVTFFSLQQMPHEAVIGLTDAVIVKVETPTVAWWVWGSTMRSQRGRFPSIERYCIGTYGASTVWGVACRTIEPPL
jgi:hypothetical protein